MNFFEAQDQARKGTTKLIVLFGLAVLGIVIALNLVGLLVVNLSDEQTRETGRGIDLWQPGLFALITLGTVVLVGGASTFKTAQLHGDGGKVARMLGGRLLDGQTQDPDERKVLNVVEEMSLASGMPVPDVYVLDKDLGINAFAAGSDVDSAAIGVTRGTIERLSRDELQGVIAHEFSHALNGDMKLNIRLIGIIFGILVIGLLGYTIFRYAPYFMGSGRSRSRDDKGGQAAVGMGLLVVGALVWAIGSIGVFFGRMIQASVSRQREYLADASAVQFTRNPNGIRDALRKIGGTAEGAKVSSNHAGECAHLFFASGFSAMFATHPPLPQRIKAIDPRWDGSMLALDPAKPRRPERESTRRREKRGQDGPLGPLGDLLGGGAVAAGLSETPREPRRVAMGIDDVAGRVGRLSPEDVAAGHDLAASLPEELRHAARRPDMARGLVASVFLSDDRQIRMLQDDMVAQADPEAAAATNAVASLVRQLGPAARLPLVELASPALRHLGPDRGKRLLDLLRRLIEADERVEPSEYALFKVAERVILRTQIKEKSISLSDLQRETGVTLTAIALAGHPGDASQAKGAFLRGLQRVTESQARFEADFTLPQLDKSLERLAQSRMSVKQQVLEAATAVVAADGQVTVEEAELLRAIGAVLGCPMPPIHV